MPPSVAALAIGVAGAVVVAACALAWGASPIPAGSLERVLFPRGALFQVPGLPVENLTIPPQGGVLIGSVHWDHSSVLVVLAANGTHPMCPTFSGYAGPPWTQHLNESLSTGTYFFGALCGGFGNGTVTQPIEITYP